MAGTVPDIKQAPISLLVYVRFGGVVGTASQSIVTSAGRLTKLAIGVGSTVIV